MKIVLYSGAGRETMFVMTVGHIATSSSKHKKCSLQDSRDTVKETSNIRETDTASHLTFRCANAVKLFAISIFASSYVEQVALVPLM